MSDQKARAIDFFLEASRTQQLNTFASAIETINIFELSDLDLPCKYKLVLANALFGGKDLLGGSALFGGKDLLGGNALFGG